MHNLNVQLYDPREAGSPLYNVYLDQKWMPDPESTEANPLPPIACHLTLFGQAPEVVVSPSLGKVDGLVVLAEGFAQRHPKDNFNKTLGRKLAWERLVNTEVWSGYHLFSKETRGQLWDAYRRLFRYRVQPQVKR